MSDVIHTKTARKTRGRPITFNQDEALEKAQKMFWAQGFEGTSMAELTQALQLSKPSIYAAFGNKEALFRKALTQYMSGPAAFVMKAANQPTARLVAEKFLLDAVDFFADASTPNGCMVVQAALTCGESAAAIQAELIEHRKNYEAMLRKRFDLAKTQGDLLPHANSLQLAKYLATIHQGLSVQASTGATKQELLSVVKLALTNLQ
jgi:AcrR family transcriptional regulator